MQLDQRPNPNNTCINYFQRPEPQLYFPDFNSCWRPNLNTTIQNILSSLEQLLETEPQHNYSEYNFVSVV